MEAFDTQPSCPLIKESPIKRSRNLIDIPPEIVYPILQEAISSYIDFAITEPQEARSAVYLPGDNDGGSQTIDPDIENGRSGLPGVKDELPDNTIIPFLSVSYLFRDTTLKILSEVFYVKRKADGDGACVHPFVVFTSVADYSL
jgi:hypothetical protein